MWQNVCFIFRKKLACLPAYESTDKAQLCLFGSSKNGFGFRDSDLDICMTLEGHETAEVGGLKTHTPTHSSVVIIQKL